MQQRRSKLLNRKYKMEWVQLFIRYFVCYPENFNYNLFSNLTLIIEFNETFDPAIKLLDELIEINNQLTHKHDIFTIKQALKLEQNEFLLNILKHFLSGNSIEVIAKQVITNEPFLKYLYSLDNNDDDIYQLKGKIRSLALNQIISDVDSLNSDDAVKLIDVQIKRPIFSTHRSSFFTWGNTCAVNKLEKLRRAILQNQANSHHRHKPTKSN